MVNFELGRDLAVKWTLYQHKGIHKATLWSTDNKICNHIDHVLVGRKHWVNVCDMRSLRGAEIDSDNFSEGYN
jgi:hypothetical protein